MIESYLTPPKMMLLLRGGYEYVDLGLPSHLKWAKCNVGAEKETDYGDYFMWGDTRPNIVCRWANAPFNNGSNSFNSDYFNSVKDTVCPNGVLAKEYDAAAQIMGGNWRMPTRIEFQELLNNTTNEWTTINGVNGWKFTGSNGNSIFIPASGDRLGSLFSDQGSIGSVWSSSLYTTNTTLAGRLYFRSSKISATANYDRFHGFVVRGGFK